LSTRRRRCRSSPTPASGATWCLTGATCTSWRHRSRMRSPASRRSRRRSAPAARLPRRSRRDRRDPPAT
jgi:hypothetical protein